MNVKVISLNLWLGGKLMPKIIKFIKSEDADILIFQEVYNSKNDKLDEQFRTYDFLKEALDYKYAVYDQALIHDIKEGYVPNGNAIFSKYPILDNEGIFLTEPAQDSYKDIPKLFPVFPRLLQHARLEINAMTVDVYNIHGVWDIDGDNDSPQRQAMVAKVLNSVSDKQNVILAGDTNAKASNPALLALEPTLKSVFGLELKTTFNMKRKTNPGYATAAVDLMYVSPRINIISKEAPIEDVSDHLPLVVTLNIPQQ